MFKSRYVVPVLILTLLLSLSVHADEADWRIWQERFNLLQAEKETDPEQARLWETRPLGIKEIEVTAILQDADWKHVSEYRGQSREKCITCHDGIAEISSSHPLEFGCTVCHGGDGTTVEREDAHATLIYDPDAGTGKRNPSSLRVVEKSCGQAFCHAGHEQEDRNHIQRVKKSLMNTMAGVISGLRYQWAAQSSQTALFGTRSIIDDDGSIPRQRGALPRLRELPYFSTRDLPEKPEGEHSVSAKEISHHISDSLLRERCFQCHLDSPGGEGEYRSQGCAACHFTYEADGLYRGDDPTIPRTRPGHPAFHKMTAVTPNATCLQCHKNFSGDKPLYLADETTTDPHNGIPLFPGSGQARQDVHFAAGLACVDCHTQFDIMGDGNLYSKQHQAVEVRCETCHGDSQSLPSVAQITDANDRVIRLSRHYPGWTNSVGDRMVVSARNRKMTNVKIEEGRIVTLEKQSGLRHLTPLVRHRLNGHNIKQHRERLECTACHSQWVSRCSGCHTSYDQSRTPGASETGGYWSPARSFREVVTPVLMVGPRGKVVPMLSQPERTLSVLDEKGRPVAALESRSDSLGRYREWAFTNPHGYSGSNLAYALNPHSVGRKAPSCAHCHLSPKTLGLGEGDLKFGRRSNGKNDRMEPLVRSDIVMKNSGFAPDAKGTLRGEQLAGTSQEGARPFNQKEIIRILKVGNCLPCHDRYDDPIYRDIRKSYRFERTVKHRRLRNKILTQK